MVVKALRSFQQFDSYCPTYFYMGTLFNKGSGGSCMFRKSRYTLPRIFNPAACHHAEQTISTPSALPVRVIPISDTNRLCLTSISTLVVTRPSPTYRCYLDGGSFARYCLLESSTELENFRYRITPVKPSNVFEYVLFVQF